MAIGIVNSKILVPQAQFGGASHYSSFEADGTLVRTGNATVWEDLNLGNAILGGGAAAAQLVNVNASGINLWGYDASDVFYGSFELPHDYLLGSAVTWHIHFLSNTGTSGNVGWTLDYQIVDGAGAAAGTNTQVTAEVAIGAAWTRYDANFSATGSHAVLGGQVFLKLARTKAGISSEYAGRCMPLTFGIHYESDLDGSRQITTK